MKMKKARLALYITLACLLVASALGTAYAKYTSEHPMDSFNVYVTAGTVVLSATGDESHVVIPGTYLTLQTTPMVSVDANSEDCYVFLKVDMSEDVAKIMTVSGLAQEVWKPLVVSDKNVENVYYRESTKADNDPKTILNETTGMRNYAVFADTSKAISVSHEATQEQVDATSGDSITFTAYAVQKTHGIETVEAAWRALNPQS